MRRYVRSIALLLALVTLLSFPASADTSMYYQELLSHEMEFTISASSPYTFSVSLPSRPSTDLFFITECYSPPTFSWGNYKSVVVWTSGRYTCHVLTVNNVNAGAYNITCSTNDPDAMGIRLFSVFCKRYSTSVSLKPAEDGERRKEISRISNRNHRNGSGMPGTVHRSALDGWGSYPQ